MIVEGVTATIAAEGKRNGFFNEIGGALQAAPGYDHVAVGVRREGSIWRWRGTVHPTPADARSKVTERLRAAGWVVDEG